MPKTGHIERLRYSVEKLRGYAYLISLRGPDEVTPPDLDELSRGAGGILFDLAAEVGRIADELEGTE